MIYDELVERFIRYCLIDSHSQRGVGETVPSTSKQFELARILEYELKHIGIYAETSEFCTVYESIPSNVDHTTETIGFFVHLETSPDAPASPVIPAIHKKITGENIKLCDGVTIQTKDLMMYKDQDIISSDGNTLLGADDNAGVAALIQFATIIQRNSNIQHGNIKKCFTQDEEIMNGIYQLNEYIQDDTQQEIQLQPKCSQFQLAIIFLYITCNVDSTKKCQSYYVIASALLSGRSSVA
ncbi:MAG: putative peptidase T [Streblomastix strix]|uniref:Putative peptidase T n=1 Tax=Streblomastix strix TaxID=222440 RepID=A0A5J4WBM4_9EUKA|nr:MAG: putative peptidase T [Streblomastix strix]